MKNNLVKVFLLSCLFLLSHFTYAGDKGRDNDLVFTEKQVNNKGIYLSDLGLLNEGLEDSRIIQNASIRYDANYAPADGEPFNLY